MLSKVKRVEVIDQNGRSYVNWDENNVVEARLQDDDRTLKVFIYRVDKEKQRKLIEGIMADDERDGLY